MYSYSLISFSNCIPIIINKLQLNSPLVILAHFMNLNKSLTIHDSHMNSVLISQLNDSCDRALSDLGTARSL